MLTELTKEQQQLMLTVRDRWINLALKDNKKGIDKVLFEEGITWLYQDLLKKPKPKIVYCDSWIGCLLTIAIFKKTPKIDMSSVWASVWASVGASVGDSVWASVGASVGDSVWDSVGDSVGEHSAYNGWSNFGWVSFYDFFEEIKVLDNFKFKQYKKLIKSNAFEAYEYDNYIFAIQPPISIVKNDASRLHNPKGMAVQFKDGSGYYFINGRSVPAWVFEKAETGDITKELFISEKNSDIKGAIYEVLGQVKMMELLGAEEIDKQSIVHMNGDIEVVTLLKTKDVFAEIDNQPFAWVKMICPSTGTQYLQGVEPHHTNALEAIASLSMFKAEEYRFDLRS